MPYLDGEKLSSNTFFIVVSLSLGELLFCEPRIFCCYVFPTKKAILFFFLKNHFKNGLKSPLNFFLF